MDDASNLHRVLPDVQEEHVIDMNGCARCHGDGHPAVEFKRLTHPVEAHDAKEEPITWTHWAPCPTNGEPILLRFLEVGVNDHESS